MSETVCFRATLFLLLATMLVTGATSAVIAEPACCPTQGSNNALCTSTQSMEVIPDPFIPANDDGTPRQVLAVKVHICDKTDADRVTVCDKRSVLVAADGSIAARLAYLPEYDGGAAWPRDPRDFSARLLFTMPPQDVHPVWLRVVARRYRLLPITLEWTGGEKKLAFPLRGGSDGLTVVIERMEVANAQGNADLAEEVRDAGDHLQITLRGEAVVSDVNAPDTDWARLGIETSPGVQPLRPDYIYTVTNRTRLDGGLYREETKVTYHFLDLTDVPAVSSLTLVVQRWLPLEEHWSELP